MSVQLPLTGLSLKDSLTFSSFYPGRNEEVLTFLKHLVEGKEQEQFIYLWGTSGAGVSHLLQATCYEFTQEKKACMYIPLSQKENYVPHLLEDLDLFHLVCLDDVECLEGDASWQEAVFHLYNCLRDGEKKLMVGSHEPLQTLNLLPDLKSRLAWGLNYEVKSLSDEEKIKALQLRARTRGFELSEEVAQFILRRVPRNMNTLFSTFDALDAAAIEAQRRITIPFVKSVLAV